MRLEYSEQDMIEFAQQFSEFPDEIDAVAVISFKRSRARDRAIEEFIKQYDELNK